MPGRQDPRQVQINNPVKAHSGKLVAAGLALAVIGTIMAVQSSASTLCGDQELQLGSKGSCVEVVQRHVKAVPDGKFDNDTKNAVMKFQTQNNLSADGVVDSGTWQAVCRQAGLPADDIEAIGCSQ